MSRSRRHLKLGLAVGATAALLAALLPASASAHAFLIRSSPQPGSRLGSSPRAMTLYFSEAFVRGSERVSIRRLGGAAISLPAPKAGGAVIHQSLPPRLRGVFVVSWRVLSDDGHISLGEFAFAVAAGAAALPTLSNSGGGGTSWSDVGASWLFFLGFALAFGGLASERYVWRRARVQVARAPAMVGLLLAALANVWLLVLVAGAERGGGFDAGLSGSALGNAVGTRPGTLTLITLAALTASVPFLRFRRVRSFALVPLLAAVVATAVRGHSGTANDWWALTADIVHLAAAALWLGALAHLVLAVARASDRVEALAGGARGYSRLALPTVLVVIASGVVTAIPEFRNLAAVVNSNYGRTLLIKAGLIGVALMLALASRRRALPGNPQPRWPLLRRLTQLESAALVGVLVAVAVLVNAAPPRSLAAPQIPAILGPPPLGPAVRLADMAGQLVVGVAATRGGELQFTIAPPSDQPKESVKLTAGAVEPDGRTLDLFPRTCGTECFTINYPLKRGRNVITARVSSSVWKGGDARFVIPWPLAPEQPAIVRRIATAMRHVRSLHVTEAVTSGPGSGTPPATYELTGRQFMQTEEFAGGGVDVRALGRQNGLTDLAFALPGSSIWYRMWIDDKYRLRREQILDPGHLIRRTFSYSGGATPATRSAPPSAPTVQPQSGALAGAPPPPPAGAVVFGREDGALAVGLAISAEPGGLELQTSVIGPDGKGVSSLAVRYRLRTSAGELPISAVLCGSGCYRAVVPSAGRPQSLLVAISGAGRAPRSLSFALPVRWPAPGATALLRRAAETWRRLRSLVISERLGSDPTHVLHTRYELVAPDKLRYQIVGGADAVVIGRRRWDRQPGQAWKESSTPPLAEPALQWARATNVHLLGGTTIAGRPVWQISFYDPSFGGFFEIWVDKTSARTLQLTLVAAAHFMHHSYSGFNAPVSIVPPARR